MSLLLFHSLSTYVHLCEVCGSRGDVSGTGHVFPASARVRKRRPSGSLWDFRETLNHVPWRLSLSRKEQWSAKRCGGLRPSRKSAGTKLASVFWKLLMQGHLFLSPQASFMDQPEPPLQCQDMWGRQPECTEVDQSGMKLGCGQEKGRKKLGIRAMEGPCGPWVHRKAVFLFVCRFQRGKSGVVCKKDKLGSGARGALAGLFPSSLSSSSLCTPPWRWLLSFFLVLVLILTSNTHFLISTHWKILFYLPVYHYDYKLVSLIFKFYNTKAISKDRIAFHILCYVKT